MNMKITAIICALAYFTVISGTPCGNHKREASEGSEGSAGSSGLQQLQQQMTNLFSGGSHNNSNENEEHKTESSIPFVDSFTNSLNQFGPHNRGKREESAEKPSEESSQNPFGSNLSNQIGSIFKPDQMQQQITGLFGGKH